MSTNPWLVTLDTKLFAVDLSQDFPWTNTPIEGYTKPKDAPQTHGGAIFPGAYGDAKEKIFVYGGAYADNGGFSTTGIQNDFVLIYILCASYSASWH